MSFDTKSATRTPIKFRCANCKKQVKSVPIASTIGDICQKCAEKFFERPDDEQIQGNKRSIPEEDDDDYDDSY